MQCVCATRASCVIWYSAEASGEKKYEEAGELSGRGAQVLVGAAKNVLWHMFGHHMSSITSKEGWLRFFIKLRTTFFCNVTGALRGLDAHVGGTHSDTLLRVLSSNGWQHTKICSV